METPGGLNLDGKVVVCVKSASGEDDKNLPLFERKTNTVHINLLRGKRPHKRFVLTFNRHMHLKHNNICLFPAEAGCHGETALVRKQTSCCLDLHDSNLILCVCILPFVHVYISFQLALKKSSKSLFFYEQNTNMQEKKK